MQTLHVTYEFPGETRNCGGGGQAVSTLCNELVRRGHPTAVVTDEGTPRPLLFPIKSYRNVDAELAANDYDVLHGHFSVPSSVFLPRLARKHGVPLAVTVMGADAYDPTRYRCIRPVLDTVNDAVFEAADAVVAPSTDMQARIRKKHGFDPHVIPHGTPANMEWIDRSDREPTRVLSVCRLVGRKNLRLAVDTVERLRRTMPDVTYGIVGDGPQRRLLDRLATSRDWLSVYGRVDDVEQYYRHHDVFFLPSKHEAFGMVFVEALQSGLPVVTTDTGGQTDIVDDSVGECAKKPYGDTLLAALQNVIKNYDEFQANTEGYVASRFDATTMANNYVALYRTLTE